MSSRRQGSIASVGGPDAVQRREHRTADIALPEVEVELEGGRLNVRFHVEAERVDPHEGIRSSSLFLIGLKAVVRYDDVPLLWKNKTFRDLLPLGIGSATQFFRSPYRVT